MTPNQISAIIADAVKRPLDVPFRLMVFDYFLTWRSTLIKNSIQKDPRLKNMFLQTLVLKLAPYSTAGCTLPECIDSAATVDVVPLPIKSTVSPFPYNYVGGIQGDNGYTYGRPAAARYMSMGKYSKDTVYWYLDNGRVIVLDPVKTHVAIVDAFDNPIEVAALQCTQKDPSVVGDCDTWNLPLQGTPLDIIQQGIEYTTQYILQQVLNGKETEIALEPKSQTP